MKLKFTMLVLAAMIGLTAACASQKDHGIAEIQTVAGVAESANLIISYNSVSAPKTYALINKTADAIGAEEIYSFDSLGIVVIALPPLMDVEEGIRCFAAVPGVILVRQDHVEQLNKSLVDARRY